MSPRALLELAGGMLLLLVLTLGLHWRGERDDLRSAVSIAAHATDKHGPAILSTSEAIAQVRVLGRAVDQAELAGVQAAAADAAHVIKVERADAQTVQEVSSHVLAELDQTRDALAASRALAAQRLRALAAARAYPGGGGDAPIAEDPDATCGAAFSASCDEVLALLAEAESNTAKLTGWQTFWADVQANHDGAASALEHGREFGPVGHGAEGPPVAGGAADVKADVRHR